MFSKSYSGNLNNYMFDTSAYNYLNLSAEKLSLVEKSIEYGFCYYSTGIQDMELSGYGAKVYNKECKPVIKNPVSPEFVEKMKIIDNKLNIKKVPEIAICMRDHTRVDGTCRFAAKEGKNIDLFKEIMNKNKPSSSKPYAYSHDAVIAEASIYYNCILVTNDGELKDTVNEFFCDKAITVDELINKIKKVCNIL